MNWEDIVVWIIFTFWALFVIFLLIASEVNVLKLVRSVKRRFNFRPSPLQREIMQEEKEIKDLERLKADIEQRNQLREEKEQLWEEVTPEIPSRERMEEDDRLEGVKARVYTPEQTDNILNGK